MTWLGNPRTEQGATPPVTPQGRDQRINASPYKELRHGPQSPLLRHEGVAWPVINWPELRDEFIEWSKRVAGHSDVHRERMVSYLDRHLGQRPIRGPEDLRRVLMECDRGRRHLQLGLRNLAKFLEWLGWPEEITAQIRKLVKVDKAGVDDEVPSEEEIIRSLEALEPSRVEAEDPRSGGRVGPRHLYWALYNLILDSGARLEHAIEVLNGWDEKRLKACDGFYIYVLGKASETKRQPYVFLTPYTVELVREAKAKEAGQKLTRQGATSYFKRHKAVAAKYIRKFVYSKLIALGVPESVADFIQGRAAKTVGARSYLAKLELAKQHYARYARYLAELRARAGLMGSS